MHVLDNDISLVEVSPGKFKGTGSFSEINFLMAKVVTMSYRTWYYRF